MSFRLTKTAFFLYSPRLNELGQIYLEWFKVVRFYDIIIIYPASFSQGGKLAKQHIVHCSDDEVDEDEDNDEHGEIDEDEDDRMSGLPIKELSNHNAKKPNST